ncbi:MAG TPA: LysE family translocator [Thermoleophilaceae bacterium]|nr:LysE family translocator [Thermoleophilaceae bacterium]
MPDASTLLVFTAATALFLIVPGPSVIYIVTRSLEQGQRAGLASLAGVESGALVHVVAATVGISAVLASSAVAFSVVKYGGAAYLIWIGIGKLRSRGEAAIEDRPPAPLGRLYRDGVVVTVLNPKTAIFFLAFLPQFADPDHAIAPQVLLLGALFVALAALSDGAYALLAGRLGERLRRSARFRARMDHLSGVSFIGLGAVAALSGERHG